MVIKEETQHTFFYIVPGNHLLMPVIGLRLFHWVLIESDLSTRKPFCPLKILGNPNPV
jgi:hypothetical protein